MPECVFVGSMEQAAHFAEPLRPHLDCAVLSPRLALEAAGPATVLVFYNEYFNEFREVAVEARRRGIPTLYAIDGILEWRNSWEFPEAMGSCLWTMRPVLCHKVACVGRSQARLLESWGNLGQCELVGVPRFDRLQERRASRRPGAPLTILIMTAKVPGFTPEQMENVTRSLRDVNDWFIAHDSIDGIKITPRWRLTSGLSDAIGVKPSVRDTTGVDLASVLADVDAVITTPSTAMLEGMLHRVPVALLDYNNRPHLVPAAWSITSPEHIATTVTHLVNPPPSRMLYQDTILHDSLECRTVATPRMVRLIREMSHRGMESHAAGEPLEFPRRILRDEQDGHHIPEESFDLRTLFKDHPVFADRDLTRLQAEAGNLRIEVRAAREQADFFREQAAYCERQTGELECALVQAQQRAREQDEAGSRLATERAALLEQRQTLTETLQRSDELAKTLSDRLHAAEMSLGYRLGQKATALAAALRHRLTWRS